jgi:hypothetical protein
MDGSGSVEIDVTAAGATSGTAASKNGAAEGATGIAPLGMGDAK